MINLSKTGESATISSSEMNRDVHLKMTWKTAVDLDLHAKVRSGQNDYHVYYGDKGNLTSFPYTKLDQDAGVGNSAGDNEENMKISQLSRLNDVLLYVENFGRAGERFSRYKSKLNLKFATKEIKIDMNNDSTGKYFLIARIRDGEITCINKVVNSIPSLDSINSIINVDGLRDVAKDGVEKGKGFLRGVGKFLSNIK